MIKFAIPAVAALGLIAFAAQSRATDAEVQGSLAPMGWHLSYEGSLAKLAYGVENSDQLALMMTCEPGQAQAVIYGDVQPAGPRLLKASVTAAIDPLSGSLSDEKRISVRDPALQRLLRSGRGGGGKRAGLGVERGGQEGGCGALLPTLTEHLETPATATHLTPDPAQHCYEHF